MPVPDVATVGGKKCQTPKINTSVGELESYGLCLLQSSRLVVSEQGVPYSQCWLQLTRIILVLSVGHSLISGCNRSRGQILKALGSGEDRCPGSSPVQTEGLAPPGYTHPH